MAEAAPSAGTAAGVGAVGAATGGSAGGISSAGAAPRSPAAASAAAEADPFAERPELFVGGAFAGGLALALLMRRLARD